jgi:hypothetical protein
MRQQSFHEDSFGRILYGGNEAEIVPCDVEYERFPDLIDRPKVLPHILQPCPLGLPRHLVPSREFLEGGWMPTPLLKHERVAGVH